MNAFEDSSRGGFAHPAELRHGLDASRRPAVDRRFQDASRGDFRQGSSHARIRAHPSRIPSWSVA